MTIRVPELPECWLWPDHVIGKRESRKLREEHNALINVAADLLRQRDALRDACRDVNTWLISPDLSGESIEHFRKIIRAALALCG